MKATRKVEIHCNSTLFSQKCLVLLICLDLLTKMKRGFYTVLSNAIRLVPLGFYSLFSVSTSRQLALKMLSGCLYSARRKCTRVYAVVRFCECAEH